jgi:hypothetical protein
MLTTFQKNFQNKRQFDPNNEKDLDCFKKFLRYGRWETNGCPFLLETPHLSVPHMIQDKIVRNLLRV